MSKDMMLASDYLLDIGPGALAGVIGTVVAGAPGGF